MSTATTAATGCDAVLNIQELQDMIRKRLSFEDLKACTLVSRQWNSYFDPSLWEKCTIWMRRQKRKVLKRHGTHVRKMSCLYFDKHTLKTLLKYCPNIENLYLRLDEHSMWIQYHTLEALFLNLQHSLTNVHILFDATYFEPKFLWSLCRLTRLTHLRIDPHSLEDRQDPNFSPPCYFLSFLECCPMLRGLTFVFGPHFGGDLEEERWTRSAFKKWVRGLFDSKRLERLPASPQDAVSKSKVHTGKEGVITTITTHQVNPESPKIGLNLQCYNLRSLQLQPPAMDLPTFLYIIRHSPSMETLTLRGQWSDFQSETTWLELSTHCAHIRELNIQFNGTIKDFPTIATLITLFPRLESLTLVRQLFSKDPDLSTLAASLRKHHQQYGSPHPFKALEITGIVRNQFPIIIDVLTLPVAMESVKIGNIIRYSRFLQDTTPAPTTISQTQSPPTSGSSVATLWSLSSTNTKTIITRWPSQDSLTTLDISSIVFPDHASTFQFFTRLQEFSQLRTLHLWLFHLRDIISHVAFLKVDEESGEDPSPPTIANSQGEEDDDIVIINSMHVAPVFELLRSGLGPGITVPEAKLMIAAMPSLVDLGLVSSAGGLEVSRLQKEFPDLKIIM
ncbi:hypothetical protein BGZ96_009765 [Linnemannia gamsii]|uniref:F-box domain-containing protein n=1 Tax=Linnemannia gamsii TaxID=64522 RepID=A0ABQ7JXI5_9FUNG|nr:hypothetical protein BGZ96_009765 [Linnemannia gamsii]